MMNFPEIVEIKKIVEENFKTKTFFLGKEIEAEPGQFLMVWLPGIDEKPFSMSYIGRQSAITVEKKGPFTQKMFGLKAGDSIGVRGPYGRPFEIKANACVVAGGCGIAPVAPLIERLKNPYVIIGAKSGDSLLFKTRFKQANIVTDDGSHGKKGFTTDILAQALEQHRFSVVYTCGPEFMIKKVFELCEKHGIECQASLERYMKCGMGLCGSCTIDSFMVCRDGPVFGSAQLRALKEFGCCARLKSGKKVDLKRYYAISC